MASDIKCPNCGHAFMVEHAMSAEFNLKLAREKAVLREQMIMYKRQKEEEVVRKQAEFAGKEKELRQAIEQQIRRAVSADYDNKLRLLEHVNKENEEKLKLSRQREFEFLQKEQQLKNREAELEISIQKKLQEERARLSEELRKIEEQKNQARETEYQMRLRELQSQLDVQKRLAEEMRRKAEQGSMQLQGEVLELMLEDALREQFPFDIIEEVGKGAEGADCIQSIRNAVGKECGRIIYEGKRTKGWNNAWIEKLKNDMRVKNADAAILVTQTFPKDLAGFGMRDGVWICSFAEVKGLACAIRDGLIRVYEAQKSQENKGDKMQMLYDYLTGVEFRQRMEAIVEAYNSLERQITDEKKFMQKKWEERRKLTDKVLENTIGLYGSVKGIAGASVGNIPMLESPVQGEEDMAH